jgi:hypothetical protein
MNKPDLADLLRELILTEYPHLRGEIKVRIIAAPVLYEVRKGVGISVEIGAETLTHPSRKAIIQRCGKAAQEIHAGLTSAVTITGLTEEHS